MSPTETLVVQCEQRGCPGTFEQNRLGRPRIYCPPGSPAYAECKRAREYERKFKERAVTYNTVTRVGAMGPPLQEIAPKRKTSSTHDAGGGHEDDRDFTPGGPTSRWDEIAKAFLRGGAAWKGGRLPWKVEQLLEEAEGGVHALHLSAGTSVGQLREARPRRIAEWRDKDGERKDRSVVYERDRDPGQLWMDGKQRLAVEKAEKMRARTFRECDSKSADEDAVHSPARSPIKLVPPSERRWLKATRRKGRTLGESSDPTPFQSTCDQLMELKPGEDQ